ncbi:uncharacterized protein LAJ45_10524 [Morchella importuna]|nr:uncharacterized protein LAJ45_10524 [Morchella importuna]KAH8145403.1 hypothetical protein LAJ45_10524 [Morchella importuna]
MIISAPATATAAPILTLPDELLLVISRHFDVASLHSLTRTNRRFSKLFSPSLKAAAVLHGINGNPALNVAAKHGCLDLARLALANGNDASATDTHGQTPLHWASTAGHAHIIRLLLEHGAKPRALNSTGTGITPLYCAVKNGHYEAVDTLLSFQYGALVTGAGRDETGATILHWAALRNPHIIQRLVQCARLYKDVGFDINIVDGAGETPVHWAARAGQYRTLRALVAAGAKVDVVSGVGKTPLHVVFEGTPHEKTVDALLKAGAGINVEGPARETALHMAVKSEACSASVVIYMVEHGAAIAARTDTGETALHLAAVRGSELVAWYLIDNKADIDAMDYRQKTPLHCVVDVGLGFWRNPLVNLLLEKGANVKLEDMNGETVIDAAMRADSGLEEWEREKIREVYPACVPYVPAEYREPEAFVQAQTRPIDERPSSWKVFERESKKEARSSLESVKKLFKATRTSRYRMSRS